MADSSEHGNERTGFIKGGEFLEQLSDYISFSRRNLLHGVGVRAVYRVVCLVTLEQCSASFLSVKCLPLVYFHFRGSISDTSLKFVLQIYKTKNSM
jgi:hypothetical protein